VSISIDFETRSRVDLKTHGLDRYAKDPSTEVICMAYSIDGADPKLWVPIVDPMPAFLAANDTLFTAWNAAFEVNIIRHVLKIPVRWDQFTDSMAVAAANNIPQSLEEAAIFLNLSEQKDMTGKRLIQKLSKPGRDGKFNRDPELLRQMYEYCRQDVRTEMAVAANLRPLDASEQALWVLTQEINDRGVPVDPLELQRAVATVTINKAKIESEITVLTGGITANQPGKIAQWLAAANIQVDDLTAETVQKLLARKDIPDKISRVLELRRQGSLTSVAKYEKMLDVEVTGRIRNTLVYHGASTGRFASRGGINLQNIARPHIEGEKLQEAIGRVLERGDGGTMDELSSLVRSAIKAPAGRLFADADFSSIENRVASWIAGQNDKVEMFRNGLDEYKTFASKSLYRVPYEEVTKEMRQVSKSAVLGCMYGQGSKGLVEYAEGLGVKLSPAQSEQAVKAYRQEYVRVKESWYEFERAAVEAIRVPSTAIRSGKVLFKAAKGALWMKLPSGRLICWQEPKVEAQLTPWGELRDGVTIRNQNTFTRKWGRNKLIGSSIFQSAVQGTARDFLTEAMLRLENDGFEVINSIHDEILLLVAEDQAESSLARVVEVMTTPPNWAPGFPLAAEGWVGPRYQK
jgi:DNA polymerase bacteriophage-type